MPTRRQIRETVVQFLYCSDLEGGADPASLRGPFWQFVTESDRKALDVATLKTLQHINLGREGRLKDFTQRLPRALAALRADESLEAATENLERIEQLEEEWTEVISLISRIPRDDERGDLAHQPYSTRRRELHRTLRHPARSPLQLES
ncbi:MAG: hypothetical protein ACQKBU_06345 [Verrucomicrobiales bacterium]